MKKNNYLTLVLSSFATFGIMACGDDVTEQIVNKIDNVGAVASQSDLPKCTDEIAGQTAYVTKDKAFFGCNGKDWVELINNTVSVGDNICSSTELEDGTGFEIFCNGESIGTVRNGEKGEKGETGDQGIPGDKGAPGDKGDTGEDGTNCQIKASEELSVTIACGTETFTMSLKNFAPAVDEEECAEGDEDCEDLTDVAVSGVSQKGPFTKGATVHAYELLNLKTMKQTGNSFNGTIENSDGTFNISTTTLASPYAYFVVEGFYLNEVSGKSSTSPIKLRALLNLKSKEKNANINLVTHLEYDYVSKLVLGNNGMKFFDAKKKAEEAIFNSFHIDSKNFEGYAENYNVLHEGDGNAALLAISVLLQGNRSESELTALLASFSIDISDDGIWSNQVDRAQIADWAMEQDLAGKLETIRTNVAGWGIPGTVVPAFEAYVKNYWNTEFGFEECSADIAGTVKSIKNKNSTYYAAKDSAFTEGDSTLTRFICAANGNTYAWRYATDLEKDIAPLPKDAAQGAVGLGSINTEFVYVFENGAWRRGTELDRILKFSCVDTKINYFDYSVSAKQDTSWYTCDKSEIKLGIESIPMAWRAATDAEADTALFGQPSAQSTASDSVKLGHINKAYVFVYEEGKWRRGTDLDYMLKKPCTQTMAKADKKTIVYDADAQQHYTCVAEKNMLNIPAVWRASNASEADNFGWDKLTPNEGDVKKGVIDSTHIYVYENSAWRRGTDLDFIINKGCLTSMDGEVIQLGKSYYTCVKENFLEAGATVTSHWRASNADEADIFGWEAPAEGEGAMWPGNIDQTRIYIYDNGAWRRTLQKETQLEIGCTATNAKNKLIVKNENTIYTCVSGTKTEGKTTVSNYWRAATADEADNFEWTAGVDGDVRLGSIDTNRIYVYDGTAWRRGITLDKKAGVGCTKAKTAKLNLAKIDNKYYTCVLGTKTLDGVSVPSYWRLSTASEADTAGAPVADQSTFAWRGSVTPSNIYVYSNNNWRAGTVLDMDAGLGPCIKDGLVNQMKDSSGTRGWYRCSADAKTATVPMAWRKATNFEADTSLLPIPSKDSAAWGRKNTNWSYVYDKVVKHWRLAADTICNIYGKCNFELSTLHMDAALGPCTKSVVDELKSSIKQGWFYCRENTAASSYNQDSLHFYSWKKADDFTQNTAGLDCRYDGEFRRGLQDKDKFFYCKISGSTATWFDGSMYADTVGLTQADKEFLGRNGYWYQKLPVEFGISSSGDYIVATKYAWNKVNSNDASLLSIDKRVAYPLSEGSPDTVIITTAKATAIDFTEKDGTVHEQTSVGVYSGYFYYDSLRYWYYNFPQEQMSLGLGPCTKYKATKVGYAKDEPPHKIYPKGAVQKSSDLTSYLCTQVGDDYKWVKASSVRLNTYEDYYDTSSHAKRREALIKTIYSSTKVFFMEADTFREATASELWAKNNALAEIPSQNATNAFRCAAEDEGKSVTLKNNSTFKCTNRLYKWSRNAIKLIKPLTLYSETSDREGLASWNSSYGDVVAIGTRNWTIYNLKSTKTAAFSPYEVKDAGTQLNFTTGSMYSYSNAYSACFELREGNSWYSLPSNDDYVALLTEDAPEFKKIQSTAYWNTSYSPGTNEYYFNLYPTGQVIEETQSSSKTGYLGYTNTYGNDVIATSSGKAYRYEPNKNMAIFVTSDANTNGFFYYDITKGGIQSPIKEAKYGAVRCMRRIASDPPTRN